MNMPIFRAKMIDSDKYVEGCFNIWEQSGKIYYSIMDVFEFPSPFSNIHLIDIDTLTISKYIDSNQFNILNEVQQ
jgi:hypothetical protein